MDEALKAAKRIVREWFRVTSNSPALTDEQLERTAEKATRDAVAAFLRAWQPAAGDPYTRSALRNAAAIEADRLEGRDE